MSYELVFDSKAIDFLSGLPLPIRRRIFEKLQSSKEMPHHYFMRLSGRRDFRLRVGGYRVIADINDEKRQIEVTLIGKRDSIYRKD